MRVGAGLVYGQKDGRCGWWLAIELGVATQLESDLDQHLADMLR